MNWSKITATTLWILVNVFVIAASVVVLGKIFGLLPAVEYTTAVGLYLGAFALMLCAEFMETT